MKEKKYALALNEASTSPLSETIVPRIKDGHPSRIRAYLRSLPEKKKKFISQSQSVKF